MPKSKSFLVLFFKKELLALLDPSISNNNARSRMQAGFPAPYAGYAQTTIVHVQQEGPVTHASDVTNAVWCAATDPSCPMRLAAGADAVSLMAA